MERFQKKKILEDLQKKMVFLIGPRQVGKTWLVKQIAKEFSKSVYLNFDDLDDRKMIQERSWPLNIDLIVFDELHKMKGWKNFLKGVFDTRAKKLKILVTGSARLDTFRQTGDSLAGRFFIHRLHPFTLLELANPTEGDFEKLLTRGGFPEPFLSESDVEALRWRNLYIDGLIRDDVLDFEKIYDFRAIQLVLELLRKKVGTPVSYASIAQDVQISPITVKKYIQIFEALFIVFRVAPWSKNIARSILKEPKIYFYDTGMVKGNEGAILENEAALELLKLQQTKYDYLGKESHLYYLRTKEKKEVNFCLVENDKVQLLIEVKLSEKNISDNLTYFCDRYGLKGLQLVKNIRNEFQHKNIKVENIFSHFSSLDIQKLSGF